MKKNKFDINYLKTIIKNGMSLVDDKGNKIIIQRFPNNIIKIHSKSISWANFRELLVTGAYNLKINEEQPELNFRDKNKRGGIRVPGPGKSLGRNKKNPSKLKKQKNYRLDPLVIKRLAFMADYYNLSETAMIEQLVNDHNEHIGGE